VEISMVYTPPVMEPDMAWHWVEAALVDNKINGLGGPKHKCGDIDCKCKLLLADVSQFLFLTLWCLQSIDSQGPVLRIYMVIYLHHAKISMDADIYKKKLEEGVPKHWDISGDFWSFGGCYDQFVLRLFFSLLTSSLRNLFRYP
jgi:hypothetical protein